MLPQCCPKPPQHIPVGSSDGTMIFLPHPVSSRYLCTGQEEEQGELLLPSILEKTWTCMRLATPLNSEGKLPHLLVVASQPHPCPKTNPLQCRSPNKTGQSHSAGPNQACEAGIHWPNAVEYLWSPRDGHMQGLLTPRAVQIQTIGPISRWLQATVPCGYSGRRCLPSQTTVWLSGLLSV